MTEDSMYKRVKDKIQQDMKPVQALAPVWKRILPLLLVWAILMGLVIILFGLRSDSQLLGPWITWGFPMIQLLAVYAIVILALRWTIPGSSVPASFLTFFILLGVAIHLVISEIVFHLSPIHVEANRELDLAIFCFITTLVLGLIPLFFVIFLFRQGLPSRPVFLGLVCGLGCGLSGEAIWRMHCHYNSWNHILSAHTGAILVTGIIGFLIGFRFFRRRRSDSGSQ